MAHDVARKTSQRLEDVRKAIKDRGFPNTSLKSSLFVLSLSLRFKDKVQILSIFCRIDWGEISNIDIRMITKQVVGTKRSK